MDTAPTPSRPYGAHGPLMLLAFPISACFDFGLMSLLLCQCGHRRPFRGGLVATVAAVARAPRFSASFLGGFACRKMKPAHVMENCLLCLPDEFIGSITF